MVDVYKKAVTVNLQGWLIKTTNMIVYLCLICKPILILFKFHFIYIYIHNIFVLDF